MQLNRVLVVDDEETIRHIVNRVLTYAGCVVQVAESAEQALELIDEQPPQNCGSV